MRHALLTLFLLLAFPIMGFCAPFLCCDPMTDVTKYEVQIDGIMADSEPQDLGDGTVRLHFDLQYLANGDHEVMVRAGNLWGFGPWTSPFFFTKATPGDVLGVCLSQE